MQATQSWEEAVIGELKVSGGLLIAPEFCRHLFDEINTKKAEKPK